MGGKWYVLVIVDDYSRYSWVFFLESKDEVFEHFQSLALRLNNEHPNCLKAIRSDNGTEFRNSRQLPYDHWISYICSQIAPEEGVASPYHDVENVQRFPTYRSTVPQYLRRGCHVSRAALERLQPEARARIQREDEALLQAEAGLPEDLVWSDFDYFEEEDADFFLDQ
jgi:hypothetical protein